MSLDSNKNNKPIEIKTPFNKGGVAEDPEDDVTCANIGYALFKKFGATAENLTYMDVLNALEAEPDRNLPASRAKHFCFQENIQEL